MLTTSVKLNVSVVSPLFLSEVALLVMLLSVGAVLSMVTVLDSVTPALVLPAVSLNELALTLNLALEFPVSVLV